MSTFYQCQTVGCENHGVVFRDDLDPSPTCGKCGHGLNVLPDLKPGQIASDIYHAYKCQSDLCRRYDIEIRLVFKPTELWTCEVCDNPLIDLGGPPFDSEKPTVDQLFTDDDEERFGAAVSPTYEDGFRHGSKEGTAGMSAEDLRAQLIGYREIARTAENDMNRAKSEVKAVETQRSELLRLIRDFMPNWMDGTKVRTQPEADWRKRYAQTMGDFKDVPAPNIVYAQATASGSGTGSAT